MTRTPTVDDALRFEHLIQINDPDDTRLEPISRTQLWRGLLLRASTPQLFIPWLDGAHIEVSDEGSLQRRLRFGSFEVRDRVRFRDESEVHYDVDADSVDSQFSLSMHIESPAAGALFVRFIYAAQSVDHHTRSPLGGLVKNAYRKADEDTVFRIRQLAARGALDDQ